MGLFLLRFLQRMGQEGAASGAKGGPYRLRPLEGIIGQGEKP